MGRAAVYGSDNHSPTLFDARAGAWNLARLDSILRRRIRKAMPGASTAALASRPTALN